jgi:hypothetical protein
MAAKLRHRMEIGLLRRRWQIADRHVFDHAAAKKADLSYRKTSCLKGWALTPTILSDRRRVLRLPLNCRASGFVQSPTCITQVFTFSAPPVDATYVEASASRFLREDSRAVPA